MVGVGVLMLGVGVLMLGVGVLMLGVGVLMLGVGVLILGVGVPSRSGVVLAEVATGELAAELCAIPEEFELERVEEYSPHTTRITKPTLAPRMSQVRTERFAFAVWAFGSLLLAAVGGVPCSGSGVGAKYTGSGDSGV